MNNKIIIKILEIIIVLYELTKVVLNYSFGMIDIIFWIIITLVFIIFNGLPRDKNYLKKDSIIFTFVSILSYILVMYIIGAFTGFVRTPFNISIPSIIKNSYAIIIIIICQEILRHIICKKSGKKLNLIAYYTILIALFFVLLNMDGYNFTNNEDIFIFTFSVLLPEFARQLVYTYICYNISYVPSLIYSIIFNTIMFFVPIYPNVGDYLNSVFGLLFPVLVYLNTHKLLCLKNNEVKEMNKRNLRFITIPLLIFGTILIILISGLFSYKIVAIGSNSMNPVYYKGDAIIYKKVDTNDINVGDIIAFKFNNYVITHRVVKIEIKNNIRYFTTKGDNNESNDNVLIPETDVCGVVKYIVKYVGYPTIWFNDLIES